MKVKINEFNIHIPINNGPTLIINSLLFIDCAEQTAAISDAECQIPATVTQSQITKTFNQPVDTSTGLYKDSSVIVPENKMTNIQQQKKDDKNVYQPEEMITETLDIRKSDIQGSCESVNDYCKRSYQDDDKVQQKRAVDFRDTETCSLTIHNDISQKLAQKKHNDNTSKNQNSYDKKLNQPNIKPSVSNVFSSLNEYINASSGNMERIDCLVDRNECKNSKTSVDKQINSVIVKNSIVNDSNKKIINTTTPEYQNILLPIKFEARGINNKKSDEQRVHEPPPSPPAVAVAAVGIIKTPSLYQQNKSDGKSLDCSNHIYENVHISTNIPSNTDTYSTDKTRSMNSSRSTSQDETKHVYENVDFGQSNIHTDKDTVYECIYIGNTNELPETTTELEIAAKRLNEQFTVTQNTSENETINSEKLIFQTVNINQTTTEHKPVGFSTIDDLSEEELNKYLAELEAEERAKEGAVVYENVSVPGPSLPYSTVVTEKRIPSQHEDEDANEAPIFETVTIGELPQVSEVELQEKAKKFPVIDYSKSGTSSECSDFLEKRDSEKFHETVKAISGVKERKIKKTGEKVRKSSNDTECNTIIQNYDVNKEINDNDSCNYMSKNVRSGHNDNVNASNDSDTVDDSFERLQESQIQSATVPINIIDVEHNDSLMVIENSPVTGAELFETIENSSNSLENNEAALENNRNSLNNSDDDLERPSRPQTLDIISTVTMDEPATIGELTKLIYKDYGDFKNYYLSR